eukprot:3386734-Pyramimonas_sp.AAC.1
MPSGMPSSLCGLCPVRCTWPRLAFSTCTTAHAIGVETGCRCGARACYVNHLGLAVHHPYE